MLAALNITALALGVAGGGLVATIAALGLGGLLSVLDVADGADIGLLVGVLMGLFFGGWVGGRLSLHSHRFHGSVVGLFLTAVIVLLASTAAPSISVLMVVWLAFLSIAIGGLGGWLGGRNRAIRN